MKYALVEMVLDSVKRKLPIEIRGLSASEGKGLCYYGATTMMGAKNGVAKRFKYLNSKILVVHCFEHLLIYARFH